MPTGKRSRCLACSSPRRAEIDQRLLGGKSSHKVAKWLKEQGEVISQPALASHKRAHLDVKTDVKAILEARAVVRAEDRAADDAAHPEAAEVRRAVVSKVVADVTMLDELAGRAMHVIDMLTPEMIDPSMAQSAVYSAMMKEARELVRQRDEMLRPDSEKTASNEPAVFRVELSYPERPVPSYTATDERHGQDSGNSPEPGSS